MEEKKIVITGGTGFIGTKLCSALLDAGHQLLVLTRNKDRAHSFPQGRFELITSLDEIEEDAQIGAVINLAGYSIGDKKWSPKVKKAILDSRVDTTSKVVGMIKRLRNPPRVLLSSSAVGFYGDRQEEELDESSEPKSDFLSSVCQRWEEEAKKAGESGVRVCLIRTGIVLGPKGGVLPKMALPFQFYVGGPVGSGKQWVSWIHLEDMIQTILFCLNNENVQGPVNAVAPQPVTNAAFSKQLGKALGKPSWIRTPGWILRLALGEMADLLVQGQKVFPNKLLGSGFAFKYPELGHALDSVYHHQ